MTSDQTHIIVGGSLAGAKAAETLRQEGPLPRAWL
jgi:predicted NAD/FAD-dependent oxidoreductase